MACLGGISYWVFQFKNSPLCQSLGPTNINCKSGVQNGHQSYLRCLFLSPLHALSTPKQSPTSETQNWQNIKSVCAKAQHHKSKWCSSSSSWTYLCNIPVPLSFWTWLKDLVAPHFVASTALDHSLISNSRNPHEGILNSQLWTQPTYPMLLIFLTFNL